MCHAAESTPSMEIYTPPTKSHVVEPTAPQETLPRGIVKQIQHQPLPSLPVRGSNRDETETNHTGVMFLLHSFPPGNLEIFFLSYKVLIFFSKLLSVGFSLITTCYIDRAG